MQHNNHSYLNCNMRWSIVFVDVLRMDEISTSEIATKTNTLNAGANAYYMPGGK